MKLYLESLRRMLLIGLTLLLVTMVATVVVSMQMTDYNNYYQTPMESCQRFSAALMGYVFIGGTALAFNGFSFLMRRADSDFYHSIPVKRTKLYLSVVLAGATWIAATVLMSVIASAATHLIRNIPFVPAYPFINLAYYIVATLVIFAAASVAMGCTGNWFAAIIVTVLAAGLPRFLLYLIASTVLSTCGSLLNWQDLNFLLNPGFNSATAIAASLLSFSGSAMRMDAVAYSLLIAVLELGLGAWLFKRRPSETAGRGAQSKGMQTLFACAFALPMVAYVVFSYVDQQQRYSTMLLIMILLSLGCYAAFQAISLKNASALVRSLPWYVCTVAVSFGLAYGAKGIASVTLNVCPRAEQIRSVEFLGNSYVASRYNYRDMLFEDISFTDDQTRRQVADALEVSIERRKQELRNESYVYSDSEALTGVRSYMQTVRIHTNSGGTIVRTLWLSDQDRDRRTQANNSEFAQACLSFPPEDSIRYVSSAGHFFLTDEEFFRLYRSFQSEYTQDAARSGRYRYVEDEYTNTNVVLADLYIGGYIGTKLYMDGYSITENMPKTASLWMEIANNHSDALGYIDLLDALNANASPMQQNKGWNSFSMTVSAVNCPYTDRLGRTGAMHYLDYYSYYDAYTAENQSGSPESIRALAKELIGILQRGVPCTDPEKLYLSVTWGSSTMGKSRMVFNPTYLSFTPADEARVIEIIGQWKDAQEAYNNGTAY